MEAIKRPDHNFVYQGPSPEIGDLSCTVIREGGHEVVLSHWRPTEDELTVLNDGGNVQLAVWSKPLPPVAVEVVAALEGESENEYRQRRGLNGAG